MFRCRLFSLVVVLLTCFAVSAGVYNPDNIPIPKNSVNPDYISNPDSILSDSICRVINQRLFKLEDSLGVKSLVIVVEHIEGDDPYQFSLTVGNKYGVGTKDSRGVIVTLATLDRSYYILTGLGMESVLPDATCHKIGVNVMVPRLKNGEWGTAMDETVQSICGVAYKDASVLQQYKEHETSYWEDLKQSFHEYFWGWMLLLFLLRFIVNYIILDYVPYREYQLYMPMLLRWLAIFVWLFIWNPGFSLYYKRRKKQRVYYVDNRDVMSSGSYRGGGGSLFRGSSSSSSRSCGSSSSRSYGSSSSRSYGSSGGGRFGGGGAGGRF